MTPSRFMALVAALVLAIPLVADAQPSGKVFRIGLLDSGPPNPAAGTVWQWEAFREGLHAFGYVEGRSVVVDSRWADDKYERLPGLAAELVRIGVDVIVVRTTPAALAARSVTPTLPIVILFAHDPVGTGLIKSLARPGGNITGLTTLAPDLSAKRVQLLKEVVPRLSRVDVLWNSVNPANAASWRETQEVARSLGLQLQSRSVEGPKDFAGVFGMMARERPDALLIIVDALIDSHAKQIADLALQQRLPAMASARPLVEAGCLVGYAPNIREMARRGAYYVDKILRGAKPADLPFEQPTNFELVINMRTAKTLGITVPQSLLLRADRLIE